MNVDPTDALAAYQPNPTPESAGFWAATAAGRVAISSCTACGHFVHPPLARCRLCGADMEFVDVSGRGTIYSFTVTHHQAIPASLMPAPYAVAVVELQEQVGLRVVCPVLTSDLDSLAIDLPVVVAPHELPGGNYKVLGASPAGARGEDPGS